MRSNNPLSSIIVIVAGLSITVGCGAESETPESENGDPVAPHTLLNPDQDILEFARRFPWILDVATQAGVDSIPIVKQFLIAFPDGDISHSITGIMRETPLKPWVTQVDLGSHRIRVDFDVDVKVIAAARAAIVTRQSPATITVYRVAERSGGQILFGRGQRSFGEEEWRKFFEGDRDRETIGIGQ
jgi:hypothetical protein